jgi:Family of unknown function (DUF5338)
MMPRSLSVRVAERTARAKPSRGDQNRATFLAVKDDVKQALDDGWPVKAIWETLNEEGKIVFSYQTFRTYVNRLIVVQRSKRGWEHDLVKKEKEKNMGKPASAGVRQKDNKTATTGLRGFVYNPVPNEEELF